MLDRQGLLRALSPVIHAHLDLEGAQAVDFVRELISVPVERDEDGNVTVRSSPGEPPRLEEGALQAGIFHDVIDGGNDLPQLDVVAYRDPALDATDGGNVDAAVTLETVLHRPFMSTLYTRLQASSAGDLAHAMNARLKPSK